MTASAWFVAGFHFVFFGTNVHVFDIRDVADDKRHGVRTLPVALGVTGTRRVLAGLNVLWLALILLALAAGIGAAHLPMAVATGVSLGYVALCDGGTPTWVYGLVIDGLVLAPAAGLVVLGA